MARKYNPIDLLEGEEAEAQRVRDHDYRMSKIGKYDTVDIIGSTAIACIVLSLPIIIASGSYYKSKFLIEMGKSRASICGEESR